MPFATGNGRMLSDDGLTAMVVVHCVPWFFFSLAQQVRI